MFYSVALINCDKEFLIEGPELSRDPPPASSNRSPRIDSMTRVGGSRLRENSSESLPFSTSITSRRRRGSTSICVSIVRPLCTRN